MVFVTGEPGIGKTALVTHFLAQLRATESVRMGLGQCVEQYGVGAMYLPLLGALERLGRGNGWVVSVLRGSAPTWLSQLSGLVEPAERATLQRQTQDHTREKMLRELALALEELAQQMPLVLVLEDLHWSDTATVAALAYIARRQEPAQLT